MIVDEDYGLEDDGSYDACMVCDEFGDPSQLMFCHSCEQLSHVFCAGLDDMPTSGPWYCHGCVENPGLLSAATRRRPNPRGPAAWVNGRSRVPRHNRGPDEWVGVWQSVWDRLQWDIDFPFVEDEEQSEDQSEVVQRREQDQWDRRFEVARQMGAGTRFRAAADNIHSRRRGSNRSARPTNRSLHREPPRTPRNPESQEEISAWNQFEKARSQLAQMGDAPAPPESTTSSRHGRKRKSPGSSPSGAEPAQQQPERKLKRPRTRLHIDGGRGESSTTAARRNTVTHEGGQEPATSPTAGEPSSGPNFLASLLQEVEVDRFAERDKEIAAPQPKRLIVERACSPQSPGLSPVYFQSLPGMTTPPPLNLTRPKSPVEEDQGSPTYSPYSPADGERIGRRSLPHRSGGLSSPPRSKDSSPSRPPSLSYSTKAELQRMVTAVLKPKYVKKEVTKEQYTDINRDVSRLLYEKVGDAGATALAGQETREMWQRMAGDEVETAIRSLHAAGTAAVLPTAEDSASSST